MIKNISTEIRNICKIHVNIGNLRTALEICLWCHQFLDDYETSGKQSVVYFCAAIRLPDDTFEQIYFTRSFV